VRTAEALALNPEIIATACPFCLIMIDDGVKDKGAEEKVKSMDIAEIVALALGDESAPAAAASAPPPAMPGTPPPA
jgi:Fe-S oxidoreductase